MHLAPKTPVLAGCLLTGMKPTQPTNTRPPTPGQHAYRLIRLLTLMAAFGELRGVAGVSALELYCTPLKPYIAPQSLPGWPTFSGQRVTVYGTDPRETDSVSDCDSRVSRIFLALGILNISIQHVRETPYRGDRVAGTTMPAKNPEAHRDSGFASWSSDVELRAGGVDTAHHELTHAHDIFLRGSPYCHHFYEEGTAVAFEWILHKSEVESAFGSKAIETLSLWKVKIHSAEDLRDAAQRIDATGIMKYESYPLAGFVMIQVIGLQGGKTLDKIISTTGEQAIPDLPMEFWSRAYENFVIWTGGAQ